MVTAVPTANPQESVASVVEKLAKESWETINYIYVLDSDNKLLGEVDIQKLLSVNNQSQIMEIMKKPVATVHPSTDQEKAALLVVEHDLKAIAVVDESEKFLGVVSADKIIDILHKEHLEDFLRFSGVHSKGLKLVEILSERLLGVVKLRLPWLLIGLGAGILATTLVSFFQESLETEIALAFFIPVIAYMTGAIGTQTSTIYIRSISLVKINIGNYFLRELVIGLIIGTICGLLAYLFTLIWLGSPQVASIVGLSLILSMTLATSLAILTPLTLTYFKKDPALGSGPFATALQDILGLLIYFTIASVLL